MAVPVRATTRTQSPRTFNHIVIIRRVSTNPFGTAEHSGGVAGYVAMLKGV